MFYAKKVYQPEKLIYTFITIAQHKNKKQKRTN